MNPKKKNIQGLGDRTVQRLSRGNKDTKRLQRCELEHWDQLIDFAEQNGITPIDLLSDIWETCSDDIREKYDLLNLRTPGAVLKL